MSEWKEYKLGEICKVKGGKRLPKGNNLTTIPNSHPYIRVRDMGEKYLPINNLEYVPNEVFPSIKNYIVDKGDLILSIVGSVGLVSLVNENLDKASLTENCVKILPQKDILNNEFLYYFLISNFGQAEIYKKTVGAVQPKLPIYNINDIELNLPNLQTQTAIAEILSSLDDKIELNNKINQELETLAQTLFKQWFIDFEFPNENGETYKSSGGDMVDSEFGEIPKGWEVGYLEDVLEFHNGYAFTSKELESENSKECYHVFKMGHIKKGGGLNAEGTKSYFSKSKAQKLSKYVLKKGDLLMCMTDMKGNVALLGHTALMNEDDKYIVNQRVGLLRPKNDVCIDYPYLYILTNSFDFIEELRSRANSGVQVNLSTNEIKKSKILIAPKSINEQFDLITKSFYDKIFEITNENETLRNTRDFLLPKLISGELVINEINN
jgi:type I restriction enzyme S subunit